MSDVQVQRLLTNYKTLEDFKSFQEYGVQELSLHEDLENNLVENDSESPFYGIYYVATLVARLSLYERSAKFDNYFDRSQDYLVHWKIEVLPEYRGKNYERLLVDYAKSFELPIKTNPLIDSHGF